MFRQEGDEYNIIVRLKEQDRLSVSQVGSIPLVTVNGQTIPASSVVSDAPPGRTRFYRTTESGASHFCCRGRLLTGTWEE